MNRVILIGNLGRDAETRNIGSDNKLASFSLATTETYKKANGEKEQKTQWHNVVAWNGLAKIAEKYLKKGDKIMIEGKIEYESYQDKKSGETKYATKIYATSIEMLGAPKTGGNREEIGAHRADDDDLPDFLK